MSYQEHDVADLLGAYALDAVDPDEARRVEAHLASCPRCRAEVQMYQETAAFLAYAGTDAPEGIWARIGEQIFAAGSDETQALPDLAAVRARRSIAWTRARGVAVALATVAAAAITLLGVEVGHLNGRVATLQSAQGQNGLATGALSALMSPHRDVVLTSSNESTSASVAIAPDGDAYWLGSSLKVLPTSRTYEVWGYVEGQYRDLGLIGSAPGGLATFRVTKGVTKLLITNEPEGGTRAPTTPVLISGNVPTLS
jgi:anti-sigma-K factor RskA